MTRIPGIDMAAEVTSSVLDAGKYGSHRALQIMDLLRDAGSVTLDIIDPSRDWERCREQHLVQYGGRQALRNLVLVGEFDPSPKSYESNEKFDRAAGILISNEVVGEGRAAAIRAMMPAGGHSKDKQRKLYKDALRLSEAVGRRHSGVLATETNEPVFIADDSSMGNVSGAYEPICRATEEWQNYASDHAVELGLGEQPTPCLSLLLISDPEIPSQIFGGFSPEDLRDGGLVRLHNFRANYWRPLGARLMIQDANETRV